MKCLVTGGSGFLGVNLVRELVAAGWDVTAAGYRGSGFCCLGDLQVRTVRLDVTNAEDVDAAVRGHEVVFHAAGDTSFWWRRFEWQRRVNVDGTVHVGRACARHGVRRLVYTSTNDVLDPDTQLGPLHGGRFAWGGLRYNYGETKYRAEAELARIARQSALDLVILYPGFLIGPWDHTLQLGRLFFDLQKRAVPGFIPGSGSYCHVTEVARAHVAAATCGRAGAGYVVAGADHTNLTHRQVWELMAKAVGAPPPRRTLAPWLLLAWAWSCVAASEFTRRHPQIDPGMARYLMRDQSSCSDTAIRELGYRVPPVEDCINDAVRWYRDYGFLPPARQVEGGSRVPATQSDSDRC